MSSYYYGLDSSSVSTLFSSLSSSSSSSSTSLSSLSSLLSDYASIRNGSYSKLLKAYYSDSSSSSTSSTDDEDSTTTKTAVSVRDAAADLKSSVNELLSSDVFEKKTVTGSDGVKTTDYDTDAIYDAVKSFVDDYNTTIEAAGNSSNTSVLRTAANMTSLTSTFSNVLSKVGISIASDNTLSIDEDTFKSSDMSVVKSLFSGTGSYAYQMGTSASSIINSSNTQIAQLTGSFYTSSGSYSSTLYSGSLYTSYF